MKPTGPYCSVSYFLHPWHLLLPCCIVSVVHLYTFCIFSYSFSLGPGGRREATFWAQESMHGVKKREMCMMGCEVVNG
jgi:hypothetical protein